MNCILCTLNILYYYNDPKLLEAPSMPNCTRKCMTLVDYDSYLLVRVTVLALSKFNLACFTWIQLHKWKSSCRSCFSSRHFLSWWQFFFSSIMKDASKQFYMDGLFSSCFVSRLLKVTQLKYHKMDVGNRQTLCTEVRKIPEKCIKDPKLEVIWVSLGSRRCQPHKIHGFCNVKLDWSVKLVWTLFSFFWSWAGRHHLYSGHVLCLFDFWQNGR